MNTIAIEDLKLTRQREVVLRVIRERHEHLTANEVFTDLTSNIHAINPCFRPRIENRDIFSCVDSDNK
ncbi:transcriptional repressor [Leptolyngbya sp. 7M]|uniref:transcriptional repressor n=1 Tax=Leptolyngbya sp. 7M TaxID=2812896 RepID=UPI001CED487B